MECPNSVTILIFLQTLDQNTVRLHTVRLLHCSAPAEHKVNGKSIMSVINNPLNMTQFEHGLQWLFESVHR